MILQGRQLSTAGRSVRTTGYFLRYFGPGWAISRAWQEFRRRSGLLRGQLPASAWEEQGMDRLLAQPSLAQPDPYLRYRREGSPKFLFAAGQREQFASCFSSWDQGSANPVRIAERIQHGCFPFFGDDEVQAGLPPDWHANPLTGQQMPADRHWSQVEDFDFGDIKLVWELNRFGFVYPLVRAFWRTGREEFAELFWQMVESWRESNPPQRGTNWKCGQEISFRVMAWCFGLYGFLHSNATSAERVAHLSQMIGVSGRRIEVNLAYALSQQNNHGISEGMGLWTIGLLFPEFRRASQWRALGSQTLENLGRELIYDDGSFVQHSVNYHRLVLHDYLWALRLGDLNGRSFSSELIDRVAKAGAFLHRIQDPDSGQTPNYGQNDGALILPLNNCDYQDSRPIIQAIQFLTKCTRCYPRGPWDEDLLWLFGPESTKAPVVPEVGESWRADDGGYYVMRAPDSFVFTRCAAFHHRPGQADMLHLDLWWRGQNITIDAGTYSYNAPEPWNNPLAHTLYHNTVTVDGLDQMERIGRFLWFPWLHGQVRCFLQSPTYLVYWEGEHDGYKRLNPPARHRRAVLHLEGAYWLVLDSLQSQGDHDYRLHWLFPDMPYSWASQTRCLTLRTTEGSYSVQVASEAGVGTSTLVRADERTPVGWRAPRYGRKGPALSLAVSKRAASITFWTLFGPNPSEITIDGVMARITTSKFTGSIELASKQHRPLIARASVTDRFGRSSEIRPCDSC